MRPLTNLKSALARAIARFLNAPQRDYVPYGATDQAKLARVLRPADVVLVEGDRRISVAIKYLTTSSFSHACAFVGDAYETSLPPHERRHGEDARVLVEADVEEGVRVVPLKTYAGLNVRVCRPHGLSAEDQRRVVAACLSRMGTPYDVNNIVDLARYLFPMPPVPQSVRRRMLSIGAGDPTRAICSTLIARAFEEVVKFPVLPVVERRVDDATAAERVARYSTKIEREIYHVRQFNLYVPRDFDVSPYFEVVKPTLESGFDYHKLEWAEPGASDSPASSATPLTR